MHCPSSHTAARNCLRPKTDPSVCAATSHNGILGPFSSLANEVRSTGMCSSGNGLVSHLTSAQAPLRHATYGITKASILNAQRTTNSSSILKHRINEPYGALGCSDVAVSR